MAEAEKVKTPRIIANGWRKTVPIAILYFTSLLIGVGLFCLMLRNSERLVALGLVGYLYYVVLLIFGLAVAAILFGVFRSYARYTGNQLGGHLEVGGPIVVVALVVIGGFYLPKPLPDAFSVTALVHGEAGPHDLVLRNSGSVWMTLGADLRQEKTGDKGQADFKNIPARFRGETVPISVVADGFEMANPNTKYVLGGDNIELIVRRSVIRLSGNVLDSDGHPVTDATVQAGEKRVSVDNTGHFTLTLKPGDTSTEIQAEVIAPGFEPWRGWFVSRAGDATVQLRRPP